MKLAEVSTHKSAKPTPSLALVPLDLDIWPFGPKIKGLVPEIMLEHVYDKFGDAVYIGFWYIVWKKTNSSENNTPVTALSISNEPSLLLLLASDIRQKKGKGRFLI